MTEGEKMIEILDSISGFDAEIETENIEFIPNKANTRIDTSCDVCPLCGGYLTPVGMLTNYDILCKCETCDIVVLR